MKIKIKEFAVEQEIKQKDVVLEVRNPQGKHLGDLHINKAKLVWCKGKTQPQNGVTIEWTKLIKIAEGQGNK